MMEKLGLMERLERGFVLGDGGYLMGLRLRGFLDKDSMTPEVVAKHPEEVERITREFRAAGAEVLQAPICCQPSAWHSWWSQTEPVAPGPFGQFAAAAMAADIRYLGACCGAGPEHIEAMAAAMGKEVT